MFWNNKDKKAREAIEHIRSFLGSHNTNWEADFTKYKPGESNYDGLGKKIEKLNKKLNLILDHLNLEYVPESEKKEPAKLVEKQQTEIAFGPYWGIVGREFVTHGGFPEYKPKKKAGRPKKKKS